MQKKADTIDKDQYKIYACVVLHITVYKSNARLKVRSPRRGGFLEELTILLGLHEKEGNPTVHHNLDET